MIKLSYQTHIILAGLILTLLIWTSTGTLAPLAATLDDPLLLPPCNYPINSDQQQIASTFAMLDGSIKVAFGPAVRRMLYPVLALPLMKFFGYYLGGLLCNLLLTLSAYILFTQFLRKNFDLLTSTTAAWLIAVYPGISYWSGLPYPYAINIPAVLCLVILLWKIQQETESKKILQSVLLVGVLFLGYDFFPLFGPGTIAILAFRRKWKLLPFATTALLLPNLLNYYLLKIWKGIDITQGNAELYKTILFSWTHLPKHWVPWREILKLVPLFAWRDYFYSNYTFIPALFLIFILLQVLSRNVKFLLLEKCLLGNVVLLFLFLNLAPPYGGDWNMRGGWIARIYQPSFGFFILYIARNYSLWFKSSHPIFRNIVKTALAITIIGNASIGFGPVLGARFPAYFHFDFYHHAQGDHNMYINLALLGRRPLGFCKNNLFPDDPSFTID